MASILDYIFGPKRLTNYEVDSTPTFGGDGVPDFLRRLHQASASYPNELAADNAAIGKDTMNQTGVGVSNMARGAYGMDRQVGGGMNDTIPGIPGLASPQPTAVRHPSYGDVIRQDGPGPNPRLSKGGNFVEFLRGIATGAAAGSAGGNFGEGFAIAHKQAADDKQRRINQRQQQMEQIITQDKIANLPLDRQIRQAQLDRERAQANKGEYISTRNGIMRINADGTPGTEPNDKGDDLGTKVDAAVSIAKKYGLDPVQAVQHQLGIDNPAHAVTLVELANIAANDPDPQKRNAAERALGKHRQYTRAESDGGQKPATRAQLKQVETKKNDRLGSLEKQYTFDQETGTYRDKYQNEISPEEFNSKKQQVEDQYGSELESLGVPYTPYSYSSGGASGSTGVPRNPYRRR